LVFRGRERWCQQQVDLLSQSWRVTFDRAPDDAQIHEETLVDDDITHRAHPCHGISGFRTMKSGAILLVWPRIATDSPFSTIPTVTDPSSAHSVAKMSLNTSRRLIRDAVIRPVTRDPDVALAFVISRYLLLGGSLPNRPSM
jgi:hypothetical protein